MKFKILLLLMISASLLQSQTRSKMWFFVRSHDTLTEKNSFMLGKGDRSKRVFVNHDISVHYQTRGSSNQDSLRYRARGWYTSIENDSMTIRTDDYIIHDAYKWNNDSSYRYIKNTRTGFARIPMSDITKLYYERSDWKKVTAGVTILSLAAAYIVAPLFALEDGKIDLFKFRKIAYPALGVMVVSISVGIVFSQRKFIIRKPKTKEPVWTIKS